MCLNERLGDIMKYLALTLIFLLAACDKTPVEETATHSATQTAAAAQEDVAKTAAQNGDSETKPAAPATGELTYAKVSKEIVEETIGTVKNNRAGDSLVDGLRLLEVTPLAHEAFKGPIGPAKDAIVFFDQRPESDMNVLGWVIGTDGGEVKAWRLVQQTGSIDEIKAVFFEDIYEDGYPDILVTYSYMLGMGPAGAVPQIATVAFTYEKTTDQFEAHDELFDSGKMPETAADARKFLRARGMIK